MALSFLALLAIQVALTVISSLLAPRPKLENATADDQKPSRSEEGSPLPVVFGTTRVAANVTDLASTYARPDTQKVRTGLFTSKDQILGYQYEMVMQAAICHGPVDELLDVVMDNTRSMNTLDDRTVYGQVDDGGDLSFGPITASLPRTLPAMPLERPADGLPTRLSMDAPNLFQGKRSGGGIKGSMHFYWGTEEQQVNEALQLLRSTPEIPYDARLPGVSYAVFGEWDLLNDRPARFNFGENSQLHEIHFLVRRCPSNLGLSEELTNIGGGANPAEMIWEILTNYVWGLGIPEDALDRDSFVECAGTLAGESMGLNMILGDLAQADETIREIMRYIDGQVQQDPITGLLELSLNRGDYDAETLPLLDESVLGEVTFTRPSWQALKNEVKVMWSKREGPIINEVPTQPVQDLASQRTFEQVASETASFLAVSDALVANQLALRTLRMVATPLGKLNFKVNRTAANFKVGSLFRFTYPAFDLTERIYRVASVDYGTLENGQIDVEAIEDVFSLDDPFYFQPEDSFIPESTPDVHTTRIQVEEVVTVTPTLGTLQLNITDPDGQLLRVEFQTQVGDQPASGWFANEDPEAFRTSVGRVPGLTSTIAWRVIGLVDGEPVTLLSGEETFLPTPQSQVSITGVDLIAQTGETRTYQHWRGEAVERAYPFFTLFEGQVPDNYLNILMLSSNRGEPLLANGDTFITPQPQEGQVLRGIVVPVRRRNGLWEKMGDSIEFSADGGIAVVDVSARFERVDGSTERMELSVVDPRGVVSHVEVSETMKGITEGPHLAQQVGEEWHHTYTLNRDHILYLRVEVHRTDGVEPLVRHFEADYNEVPGIPDVQEARFIDQADLYVDAADTDTASLWYREVIGATVQSEVEIQPRGSDPRFGIFSVIVTQDVDRRFRIYGKNSRGEVGEYRDYTVVRYQPPQDTQYVQTLARVVASDDETVTVEVTAEPAGAEVELYDLTGTSRLDGPGVGTDSPSGTQWTFSRPSETYGVGSVRFRGFVSEGEFVDDYDIVTIEAQGKDTIPLVVRARVVTTSTDTVTVRVAVADPEPGSDITLYQLAIGISDVIPSGPQVIEWEGVVPDLDTTAYIEYVIQRPGAHQGTGRVTYTAKRPGRTQDSDSVDIPAQLPPVMRESTSETTTTGTLTLTPLSGAVFDEVEFRTRSGNGAWSPWAEDTDGEPYTASVALHWKHNSAIAYRVSYQGRTVQERVISGFDVGTIANVMTHDVTPNGDGTAAIQIQFDTDTAVGPGNAEVRVGGVTTTYEVSEDRQIDNLDVTQSTTQAVLVEVRGRNIAGEWNPEWYPIMVPRAIPLPIAGRIVSVDVSGLINGDCVTDVPQTNRIAPTFVDTEAGDVWEAVRYVNGVEDSMTPPVEPVSVSVTFVDHEVPGVQSDGSGPLTNVSYRVWLRRGAITVDSRDSNTVNQFLTPCGSPPP